MKGASSIGHRCRAASTTKAWLTTLMRTMRREMLTITATWLGFPLPAAVMMVTVGGWWCCSIGQGLASDMAGREHAAGVVEGRISLRALCRRRSEALIRRWSECARLSSVTCERSQVVGRGGRMDKGWLCCRQEIGMKHCVLRLQGGRRGKGKNYFVWWW